MSTKLMALVWPMQMPPTAKAVLVSLADNANDAGHCWPSIDTISERTCYSRRAVIDAIAWLERAHALIADRSNGRHSKYQLTLASFDLATPSESPRTASRKAETSADAAPVSGHEPVQMPHQCSSRTGADAAKTSAASALDQCGKRTLTVIEPSRTSQPKNTPERPDDVDPQLWSDWLELRRRKRAPVTATAIAGVKREAVVAGVTFSAAIAECCARGWVGFKAEWVQPARASPAGTGTPTALDRQAEVLFRTTGGMHGRPSNAMRTIDDQPDQTAAARIATRGR